VRAEVAIHSSVIFFPCFDIEATTAFYTQVIGLTLHQDQGQCRIFDTGYGYLGFCQYADKAPVVTGACISLNCTDEADVDRHYASIKNRAEIIAAPRKHPRFPVYSFFLKDPNGYVLEFQKILS
jgi:predicted enzyme related to lactoylglutathione lyase